jgi:hypothetical protein
MFPRTNVKRRLAPIERSFYMGIDRRQKDLSERLASPKRTSPGHYTQLADFCHTQIGNLDNSFNRSTTLY